MEELTAERPKQRWLQGAVVVLLISSFGLIATYERLFPHVLAVATVLCWLTFAVAVGGLRLHRPARSSGWYEAAAAIAALAVGDTLTWIVVGHTSGPFLPTIVCFLIAYVCGAIAMVRIMRRWSPFQHLSVLLDSLTLVAGVGTVIASVIWVNVNRLDLLRDPTAMLFPVLDLMLVAAVGRFWYSPGGRVRAVQILCLSIMTLVLGHMAILLRAFDPASLHPRWTQLWLPAFIGLAAACVHPTCRLVRHDAPAQSTTVSRVQAATLAVSAALPSLVLLVAGLKGVSLPWVPVSIGGLTLALLVGLRVGLLIRAVQDNTERIDLLARSDSLTGVANRRHWDQLLAEAVTARTPFWVLFIDLDHFKAYNDSRGHLAGDELLRKAVQSWSVHLPDDATLARYGGEEFAVLLPGRSRPEVALIADALRRALPEQQTCSIGVAETHNGVTSDELLQSVDQALYEAKRAGRDRVVFLTDLAAPAAGSAAAVETP